MIGKTTECVWSQSPICVWFRVGPPECFTTAISTRGQVYSLKKTDVVIRHVTDFCQITGDIPVINLGI